MADQTGTSAPPQASTLITDRQRSHSALLEGLAAPEPCAAIDGAATLIAEALEGGGTVFFFGNGGSSADAQHIAAEFVGRFRGDRRPLAAMALGTNPAVITALANDYGFGEEAFARELEALAGPGDVAVALSTSGRSPGVLSALERARNIGASTIALTGSGHGLDGLADQVIVVDSPTVALVQEMHSVIGHLICEIVEARLGVD